ncbi:photosynthetic complex assembly protein PuhC [Maritimibacter sp. UBA3975]|uniref:photosynthetic complex assembly protein PuhC n=1 Tax=Maritimibacter sp. UBA3975 TaxID=1946833 RepID=UPI000C0951B1|nr:photosynthetic complex assembly protein PuhC [Maritimibacter sp. UBA3975]MAM62914.1 pullulanase [Maritimibacter sp.]|tara:strand:- start:9048 stop:9557 length:510 start_codon:yes stop_codon:yes gene_type:complete
MTQFTASAERRRPPQDELVPRTLVRAVGLMMLAALVLVTYARTTGKAPVSAPPESPVAVRMEVLLTGDLAGAATVTSTDGTLIADLSPEEGGFISGVWRVIQRERIKHRVTADGPVIIAGHENGRVSIFDPSTGWSADLMGFGADNARAFSRLLAQQGGRQNGMADQGH